MKLWGGIPCVRLHHLEVILIRLVSWRRRRAVVAGQLGAQHRVFLPHLVDAYPEVSHHVVERVHFSGNWRRRAIPRPAGSAAPVARGPRGCRGKALVVATRARRGRSCGGRDRRLRCRGVSSFRGGLVVVHLLRMCCRRPESPAQELWVAQQNCQSLKACGCHGG